MPVVDPFSDKTPARKRIVICCDGTWQSSDGGQPCVPTNVTRLTRAVRSYTKKDGIHQIIYYQSGVGTGSTLNKLIGGGTGYGLDEHVREAYGFLAHNYHPGDSIHLLGFSRGAYTARSVCGLVCTVGILTKKGMDGFHTVWKDYTEKKIATNPDYMAQLIAREGGNLVIPNVKIKSVGCWDTVGSLGVPSLWLPFFGDINIARGEGQSFHNVELSDKVENAFHALALDEHRGPFTPTLWKKQPGSSTNLKQVWFPGVHTNIGGGYDNQEIADITLAWMIQQLSPFLEFSKGYLKSIVQNHADTYSQEWAAGTVYDSATGFMRIFSGNHRTPGFYSTSTAETEETIHKSVRIRMKMVPNWESKALRGWVWKEEGYYEKDGNRLFEDTLGNIEKKLAGVHIVKNMLGERMPKDVEW